MYLRKDINDKYGFYIILCKAVHGTVLKNYSNIAEYGPSQRMVHV